MPQIAPSQVTTFKFQTPLKAAVLNTMLTDAVTKGLLSLPNVSMVSDRSVSINKFSAFTPLIDENGNLIPQRGIKVTFDEQIIMSWVKPSTSNINEFRRNSPCGVGLQFMFAEDAATTNSSTNKAILSLLYRTDADEAIVSQNAGLRNDSFNGVIVAVFQHWSVSSTSVTTLPADWSNILQSDMLLTGTKGYLWQKKLRDCPTYDSTDYRTICYYSPMGEYLVENKNTEIQYDYGHRGMVMTGLCPTFTSQEHYCFIWQHITQEDFELVIKDRSEWQKGDDYILIGIAEFRGSEYSLLTGLGFMDNKTKKMEFDYSRGTLYLS